MDVQNNTQQQPQQHKHTAHATLQQRTAAALNQLQSVDVCMQQVADINRMVDTTSVITQPQQVQILVLINFITYNMSY